jgi:hypothetical protein
MQVMQRVKEKSNRALLTFFAVGTIAGGILAWLTARARFNLAWFTAAEWWTIPTTNFWIAASGLFFLAFVTGYVMCIVNGWLPIPQPWLRLVWALCSAMAIPAAMIFFSKSNPSLVGFAISPLIVGFFLALALFALTGRWYKLATILMILIYLVAPLIADIPDLLLSGGYRWFDAITYLIRFAFLASVCGWWLSRAAGSTKFHR